MHRFMWLCKHVRKFSHDTNTARDIFKFENTFPRDMRIECKEAFENGKCILGMLQGWDKILEPPDEFLNSFVVI